MCPLFYFYRWPLIAYAYRFCVCVCARVPTGALDAQIVCRVYVRIVRLMDCRWSRPVAAGWPCAAGRFCGAATDFSAPACEVLWALKYYYISPRYAAVGRLVGRNSGRLCFIFYYLTPAMRCIHTTYMYYYYSVQPTVRRGVFKNK